MKNEILNHLDNPVQLEKMYRANKIPFRREFNTLYPELKGNIIADFWNERLNYESEEISWGTGKELVFVLLASLLAGFVAQIPNIFTIDEEFFYTRNIGFIVLPFLTAYFAWKNHLELKKIAVIFLIMIVSLIYINALPGSENDSLILACIHLPLMLWILLGASFVGNNLADHVRRLDFLKYNGDLVVMSAVLLLAGGLMTGITIGLFSLIGLEIEEFYFRYVVVFGLPAVPIVATYLTQTNPQLVGRVSPVIARIFSPLVLVMLVIYLGAIVFSGKDPYTDREFLLLFNLLLVGVMALIFFSVAEGSVRAKSASGVWLLLLLSLVTIVVNGIALSAILFRISEWGITPNRVAVMGANVLMLLHLLSITFSLFKTLTTKGGISGVGASIVQFLPVYFIWTALVVFGFPFFFGFE